MNSQSLRLFCQFKFFSFLFSFKYQNISYFVGVYFVCKFRHEFLWCLIHYGHNTPHEVTNDWGLSGRGEEKDQAPAELKVKFARFTEVSVACDRQLNLGPLPLNKYSYCVYVRSKRRMHKELGEKVTYAPPPKREGPSLLDAHVTTSSKLQNVMAYLNTSRHGSSATKQPRVRNRSVRNNKV